MRLKALLPNVHQYPQEILQAPASSLGKPQCVGSPGVVKDEMRM
jgi:hypothetical protein